MQAQRTDLRGLLQSVQDEMRRALSPEGGYPADFYASMHYAFGWADESLQPVEGQSGKMLRPQLCLLSCITAGGDPSRAVPAAAALELLHNFTLVHDDIQDGSSQRRHRSSMWKLIGVPLAINAGDGIFVTSHLALARLADVGVEPRLVLQALEQFDKAALLVCEGQHLDISWEDQDGDGISSVEYLGMVGRKTGALMGLSCYLGALAAGAGPTTLELYRRFGDSLGTGYQIRDDLAGVWHEEASTGKRPLEDVYKRKKSYPVVRAFEKAVGSEADNLHRIYRAGPVSEEDAFWVRDLMTRLGIHEEGRERIRGYASRAFAALDEAGASGPTAEELRRAAEGLLA